MLPTSGTFCAKLKFGSKAWIFIHYFPVLLYKCPAHLLLITTFILNLALVPLLKRISILKLQCFTYSQRIVARSIDVQRPLSTVKRYPLLYFHFYSLLAKVLNRLEAIKNIHSYFLGDGFMITRCMIFYDIHHMIQSMTTSVVHRPLPSGNRVRHMILGKTWKRAVANCDKNEQLCNIREINFAPLRWIVHHVSNVHAYALVSTFPASLWWMWWCWWGA